MTAGEKVIAVDLGTSYFKACRFDLSGNLEAVCKIPAPVSGSLGRAEIPISDFTNSLTRAIRNVAVVNGASENIVAITFATQANSFALIDSKDEPLTPFILWSDQRAYGLDSPLYDFAASDAYRTRTGIATMNHLFMPLKVRWLQQNEPDAIANTRRIALLGDYFTWWLTGEWCSEASTAGLSGLLDIHTVNWWPLACKVAAMSPECLNRVVRTGTNLQCIRSNVGAALGLPSGCHFIAGCLDQHAGAIGVGNVLPGGISETTGTVLATVRCSANINRSQLEKVFLGPTFQEGLFYQMVFSEQSAGLLERYRRENAPDLTFSELDELAEQSSPGARGLRLRDNAFHLPTSEMFENRRAEHTQCDEARAILEGVARELSCQVHLLCDGKLPSTIRCVGGGANSRLWLTIKQQILGIPCLAARCAEPTAFGAALLAISACRKESLVELMLALTRHVRT